MAGITLKGKICYICEETFEAKNAEAEKYRKVRDHCHYAGKYTGCCI